MLVLDILCVTSITMPDAQI